MLLQLAIVVVVITSGVTCAYVRFPSATSMTSVDDDDDDVLGGGGGGERGGAAGGPFGDDIGPVFISTPKNITVGPGDRAVLKCRVDHLGTRTVTWKRHDEVHPLTIGLFPFAPDARIGVDYNQRTNEWSLIIHDIRPMDEGIYQCQISTKNDHDSYDVVLHVRTVQVSGTDYVEVGGTIELLCNASGRPDPPHNLEWFKNDERIRSDPASGILLNKKIETRFLVSKLTIRSSQTSDAGEYVCRTSNHDWGSVTVHVLSVTASVGKRGTHVEKMTSSSGARSHTQATTSWLTLFLYLVVSIAAVDALPTSLQHQLYRRRRSVSVPPTTTTERR